MLSACRAFCGWGSGGMKGLFTSLMSSGYCPKLHSPLSPIPASPPRSWRREGTTFCGKNGPNHRSHAPVSNFWGSVPIIAFRTIYLLFSFPQLRLRPLTTPVHDSTWKPPWLQPDVVCLNIRSLAASLVVVDSSRYLSVFFKCYFYRNRIHFCFLPFFHILTQKASDLPSFSEITSFVLSTFFFYPCGLHLCNKS